jgi:DUF4097 and DUF4098 domain-containing protein YvlB
MFEEKGIMKSAISPISSLTTLGVVGLLGLLPMQYSVAQQRMVVPLSDPTRPATLDVSLSRGNVSVTAYDGSEVIIVARDSDEDDDEDDNVSVTTSDGSEIVIVARDSDEDDEDADQPSREGLQQIRNTGVGLTAEETANTVSVSTDWGHAEVDLEISVPRRTSVRAQMHGGDDLSVTGVIGDHELMNIRGDIAATDIGGSVVVNTTNGDVSVSFTELTPGKAMSFNSFNGDIEVSLPATLAATLVISAGRGDVFTDFDFALQPTEAVVESGREGTTYRARFENLMRAVVGGGGPEIRFQTFNGDIVIRKR